jgi:DNA polymerase alpha subunit A
MIITTTTNNNNNKQQTNNNVGLVDLDEVLKIGDTVKKEVNRMYRTLEIEVDGVFKTMLLLKKKK